MGSRSLADDHRSRFWSARSREADLDHHHEKQQTLTGKILRNVRWWTLACAVVIGVVLGFGVSADFGLGFFLTALWAVLGFWVLEKLLRVAIVARGVSRNRRAAAGWLVAKLVLYALAVWVLFQEPFPVMSHVLGLTLLLVVLVVAGILGGSALNGQPAQRGDDG